MPNEPLRKDSHRAGQSRVICPDFFPNRQNDARPVVAKNIILQNLRISTKSRPLAELESADCFVNEWILSTQCRPVTPLSALFPPPDPLA